MEQEQKEHSENGTGLSDDEEDLRPKHAAYNALLAMYGQPLESVEPTRKRRKLNGSDGAHRSNSRLGHVNKSLHDNERPEARDEVSENDNHEVSENDNHEVRGGGVNAEEEEEAEEKGDESNDDDDQADSDPFKLLFTSPNETALQSAVHAVRNLPWQSERRSFETVGKCTVLSPAGISSHHPTTKVALRSIADLRLQGKLLEPAVKALAELNELEPSHFATACSVSRYIVRGPHSRKLFSTSILNDPSYSEPRSEDKASNFEE